MNERNHNLKIILKWIINKCDNSLRTEIVWLRWRALMAVVRVINFLISYAEISVSRSSDPWSCFNFHYFLPIFFRLPLFMPFLFTSAICVTDSHWFAHSRVSSLSIPLPPFPQLELLFYPENGGNKFFRNSLPSTKIHGLTRHEIILILLLIVKF